MGEAALAAVPELATISMACPNKHYIPMNLDRFGLFADDMVFIATDEPHGQIECTVGRGSPANTPGVAYVPCPNTCGKQNIASMQ